MSPKKRSKKSPEPSPSLLFKKRPPVVRETIGRRQDVQDQLLRRMYREAGVPYPRSVKEEPEAETRHLKFLRNTAYGGKDYGPKLKDGDTADVAEPSAARFLMQGRVIELAVATSPRAQLWGFSNPELTLELCNLMAEIALVVQPKNNGELLSPKTLTKLRDHPPKFKIADEIQNAKAIRLGQSTLASVAKTIHQERHADFKTKRSKPGRDLSAVKRQLDRAMEDALHFNETVTDEMRMQVKFCKFNFYVSKNVPPSGPPVAFVL